MSGPRCAVALAVALMIGGGGCDTTEPYAEPSSPVAGSVPNAANVPGQTNLASIANPPVAAAASKPEEIVLHEGDTVRITFPGAPNLNTSAAIRRDGRIVLPLIGEFQAAGLTPSTMEKELLKLYGPQLQTKEVSVSVDSSAFVVYLTGAVLRPGKIVSDRPLTALEAILEAGGFDPAKANQKKVTVIRNENGRLVHYKLNLKGVLQGDLNEPFNLKPYDIISVPERFSWF